MKLNYDKPDGCHAAVICNDVQNSTGGLFGTTVGQLTAKLVCGQRSETLEKRYNPSFLFTEEVKAGPRYELGLDVTEVLGAMCLGCPYREQMIDSPAPQPEVQ